MTNLQLIVMISAYCGTGQFDTFPDTEIYRDQITQLLNDGMITPNLNVPANCYRYKATPKGRFWLDHVLKIPYPVMIEAWEIPNVK